ncbi:MAG TPA: ComEC/Rec2 family competence protein, partial [Candidatus Paceibacterota bacterium]|nr:ComEC/Rec2 family competence protein [Candidatus Paceibacterota bacterium]
NAIVAAIALCAIAAGSARMHLTVLEREPILDARVGEEVIIEGIVVNEPDQRENNVRIPVRVASVASTTIESRIQVLVIAPLHTEVAYGDRVRAEGELQLPESFEAGAGREFNYPAYLAKDGIVYELSFANVEKIRLGETESRRVGETRTNPLKAAAIWMKQAYLDGLAMALVEPEAGLAGGITAGDKRGLGSELSETFRIVGLIHIVVLSGYNIMVVISFIERVLRRTHRYVRFSLSVFVAIFFALMTGLAASSVRAASMAVIATIGKATGRVYLAARALAVVALGMVVVNPYVLAFDPGFQLSIIATWGLISISPLIAGRLRFVSEKFGLREIAAATLGTQVAVLPLILYQSGALSLYALPANLLTLIVVPYAMLLSFVAGLVGAIAEPIAPIVGFPAYVLLWYIVSVAQLLEGLPLSSVEIPAFSPVVLLIVYAILVGSVALMQKKAAASVLAAAERA